MALFANQFEAVQYQLQMEAQMRPLQFLLRVGRTIMRNPTATREQVLADPIFRQYIWNWLRDGAAAAQTADAQAALAAASRVTTLPDGTDVIAD